MSTLCDECCSTEDGKIVTRTENRRRFEIVNTKRKQIKVCLVDGCLVQGDGKRCDYLFLVSGRAILVELKGKDRNRALHQIIESAEALGSVSYPGDVEAYIVTSRVPRADTSYQKTAKALMKRYRSAKCKLPFQKNNRVSISV